MMDALIQPLFVVPADASLDANAELLGSKAAQLARMSRLAARRTDVYSLIARPVLPARTFI
jgi:hypothetical protein